MTLETGAWDRPRQPETGAHGTLSFTSHTPDTHTDVTGAKPNEVERQTQKNEKEMCGSVAKTATVPELARSARDA